jgi:hypothetical protein
VRRIERETALGGCNNAIGGARVSWLEKLVGEITDNLDPNVFSDASHGFEDIERVIALVEKAIEQNAVETAQAGHDAALKAAADPFHSFVKKPVFAPQSSYLSSHESWRRNRSGRRFVSPGSWSRNRLHRPRKAPNACSSLFVPAG